MSIVDKDMYIYLKNWCNRYGDIRPKHQNILYVNSHERKLTNATIKKMMFDIIDQEMPGEVYLAHYSAKNFHRNMRNYYSDIGELYQHEVDEKSDLYSIIDSLPPTCGWIVLIIEDVEILSENVIKMQEMLKAIMTFASKRSSIILIGNGDYKSVLGGYEYALDITEEGLFIKIEDKYTMIGCYEQEESPNLENIIFENMDKCLTELEYYWYLLYEQLENNYFDYDGFKDLYKNTMEYIIPRVTKDNVYRKDITLIENIGDMRNKKPTDIEGCKPWEFEAARQFANGLHYCIVNYLGHNDDLSLKKIGIDVVVQHRTERYGKIYNSGSSSFTIDISIEDVCNYIDFLAEEIFNAAYEVGIEYEFKKRIRE